MRPALLVLALALAGCTGQAQLRMLEHDNAVRVDAAAPGSGADYVVSIRNLKDVGYDPDDKNTRDSVALRMLATQCPNGRIIGETVIDTGTYLLGNPARTYGIRVKCS